MKKSLLKGLSNLLSFIVAFFIIFLLSCTRNQENPHLSPATVSMLSRLDSLLATNDYRKHEKELIIERLRFHFNQTTDIKEKFNLARELFYQYQVYDSDSAFKYALIADKLDDEAFPDDYNLQTRVKLDQVFINGVIGRFDNALSLLEDIDENLLDRKTLGEYYQTTQYVHSLGSVFIHENEDSWRSYIAKSNDYRDSLYNVSLPSDTEWLWVPVALKVDELDKGDEINFSEDDPDLLALKEATDRTLIPSRDNAINAYWLSRYYELAGNTDQKIYYLALASVFDLSILNKEIAALQELANWLLQQGDIDRAYNYMIYAVNQANSYKNRSRMVSLSFIMDHVREAYKKQLENKEKTRHRLTVALSIVAAILVVALIFLGLEFKKTNKTSKKLSQVNSKLSEALDERDSAIKNLETANSDLESANRQKLEVLAYALKMTTEYIGSLDNYRKKLLKKYKGKQIDDLGQLINDPELVESQYATFYHDFDQAALSIFPDFFEEYNKAVKPEFQATPSDIKKGILTTKMRIYALRRLGLTKNSDIAAMLNISIRTVYNNRIGNMDKEEESI